jgi:hypothetical protein
MKKFFSFFLLVIMLPLVFLKAQDKYNVPTVLQVGIGYGLTNSYGNVQVPPVSIAVDFPVAKDITLGGYLGYATSKDVLYPADGIVLTEDMGINYSYFIFGGRLNYHFTTNVKNFDGYIGAMLGYNSITASTFGLGSYNISPNGSALIYGGQLGGRLYLSNTVALFAEVGYGIGYIVGGLAFKL